MLTDRHLVPPRLAVVVAAVVVVLVLLFVQVPCILVAHETCDADTDCGASANKSTLGPCET